MPTSGRIQYLHTLLSKEALRDSIRVLIGSSMNQHLNKVIMCVGKYFDLVNAISKKITLCAIQYKKFHLKIRLYTVYLSELNEYLYVFLGWYDSTKMVRSELNNILFHSMPNVWSKQAYLRGFEFDLPFKKAVNMFKWTQTPESIYKGVIFPSKSPTEDVTYERVYMATSGNKYFTDILEHLNEYHDNNSQRLSSKNIKEAVLRVMEEEEEEIKCNINNITCDTSFQSHVCEMYKRNIQIGH